MPLTVDWFQGYEYTCSVGLTICSHSVEPRLIEQDLEFYKLLSNG